MAPGGTPVTTVIGLVGDAKVPAPETTVQLPVPSDEAALAASVVLVALDGRDWLGPAAAAVTADTVTTVVDAATAHTLPVDDHVSETLVPACAATGVNTAVGDVVLLIDPAPNPVHTPPVAEPPNDAAIVAVSV